MINTYMGTQLDYQAGITQSHRLSCGKSSPKWFRSSYYRRLPLWNEPLIWTIFLTIHVDEILMILVCTRNIDNFWAWNPERKGLFLVRPTYRLLVTAKLHHENWLEGRSGSSENDRETKDWTSLWKITVPSKLKVFIWRLAKQSLPNLRCVATQEDSHFDFVCLMREGG